jgi:TetR/AcrR family transcriptional regulator
MLYGFQPSAAINPLTFDFRYSTICLKRSVENRWCLNIVSGLPDHLKAARRNAETAYTKESRKITQKSRERTLTRGRKIEQPGKTAEKILEAARAVFAEKGYSGTHVDEIAGRAGVNKATLYYQIGDKDTLYANVIHQVMGNIAQDISEAVANENNPEQKLTAYIHFIAAAVDKNPELPPIMMREMASGGEHLPRVVVQDIAAVVTTLISILTEGKKKGLFIDTVPFLIHMMIMGTILFYKRAVPIKDRQNWLPAEVKSGDRKLKGRLGDAVADLVLRAVKR